MTSPLISVIVPTWNDGATIERCVRSLERQTWPRLEILVVDDASSDETPARLEELAQDCLRLRVFRQERRAGAASARNVGFEEARGEILALIDGDMWAPPDWLERLVKPLLEGEQDVTGGPDLVPDDAPLVSRCIGYSMDSILTNGGLRLGDSKLVKYLPGTGNMAITREALRRAGGFDEEFHDTGEDKEWLHRVRDMGGRMRYLPEALAWHERKPDLLLHARKQLLSGRRRLDIVMKDPSSFEWPHFAPSLLIIFLVLGGLLPALRPFWLGVWILGTLLVFVDCLRGTLRLRDPRAFPILVFSSGCIPFGYGLGVLWRGFELLTSGRAVRGSDGP